MIHAMNGGGFQFSGGSTGTMNGRVGIVAAQPTDRPGRIMVTLGPGMLYVSPDELLELGEAFTKTAERLRPLAARDFVRHTQGDAKVGRIEWTDEANGTATVQWSDGSKSEVLADELTRLPKQP